MIKRLIVNWTMENKQLFLSVIKNTRIMVIMVRWRCKETIKKKYYDNNI